MKIGIISNSDVFIPLLSFCKRTLADIELYLGRSNTYDSGRETIIRLCTAASISIVIEEQEEDLYSWVAAYLPEIVFIAGYSSIIQVDRLAPAQHGTYNIHFGKLPEFRGANPVFWQLKTGSPTLGITIHTLTSKVDGGPVIWQQEISNEPLFNYTYVNHLLGNILVQGVDAILKNIQEGVPGSLIPQDEKKAHSYPKPGLQDVMIDWKIMTSTEIVDLARACIAWNAGAITVFKGAEVKILDAYTSEMFYGGEIQAGSIIGTANDLEVLCQDRMTLNITYLSINGIPVPARFAPKIGLVKGEQLGL